MRLDDLLHDGGFHAGLTAGAVALPVVFLFVLLGRRTRRLAGRPVPIAGIALVVAALIAIENARGGVPVSDRLVVGLALLVVGPMVAVLRPSAWTVAIATVPGAAVVAWAASLENHVDWVPPLVFVATVIGAALVADFDRANARAGLGPVLIAATAFAMYTALPDTEQIIAVAGAALPIALLGAPLPLASLGTPGAASCVGLLAWVAAIGGRARPGSFVGAAACLGVMLVEPPVRRALQRSWHLRPLEPLSARTMLIVVLHLGLIAGTSRAAGLETSGAESGALAAIALAGGAIAVVFVLFPWGRDQRFDRATAPRGRGAPARPAARPMRR